MSNDELLKLVIGAAVFFVVTNALKKAEQEAYHASLTPDKGTMYWDPATGESLWVPFRD